MSNGIPHHADIITLIMFGAICVVGFTLLAKKEIRGCVAAFVLAFIVFIKAILDNEILNPTFEQLTCWIFGGIVLWMAFRFLENGKLGEALVILFIATGMFVCSLSAVQGLLKTGILSKVNDSLVKYSEKLDGFQTQITAAELDFKTNIDATRAEIKEQQIKIQTQYRQIYSLQNKVELTQSNLDAQVETNAAVQKQLAIAEADLATQQQKIQDVESLVQDLFARSRSENFDGGDTNRVTVRKWGDSTQMFFKLKSAAIKNSVHGFYRLDGWGVQASMYPLGNNGNIAYCLIIANPNDAVKANYMITYTEDSKNTNIVQKVSAIGKDVFLDNTVIVFPDYPSPH